MSDTASIILGGLVGTALVLAVFWHLGRRAA